MHCAICLESDKALHLFHKPNDQSVHSYHADCIEPWWQQEGAQKCPLCDRAVVWQRSGLLRWREALIDAVEMGQDEVVAQLMRDLQASEHGHRKVIVQQIGQAALYGQRTILAHLLDSDHGRVLTREERDLHVVEKLAQGNHAHLLRTYMNGGSSRYAAIQGAIMGGHGELVQTLVDCEPRQDYAGFGALFAATHQQWNIVDQLVQQGVSAVFREPILLHVLMQDAMWEERIISALLPLPPEARLDDLLVIAASRNREVAVRLLYAQGPSVRGIRNALAVSIPCYPAIARILDPWGLHWIWLSLFGQP